MTVMVKETGKESDVTDTVRVPREPTDEKVKAGVDAFQHTRYFGGDPWADWKACYRAMLSAAPQSSDVWMKDRLEKLEAQLATTYHGPWKFIGGFTQSGAGKVLKQTGERTTIGFGCCDCWFFSKEQG